MNRGACLTYSPWGGKELGMTERLRASLTFVLYWSLHRKTNQNRYILNAVAWLYNLCGNFIRTERSGKHSGLYLPFLGHCIEIVILKISLRVGMKDRINMLMMSGNRVVTREDKCTYDLSKMKKNNVVCVGFKVESLCTHDLFIYTYLFLTWAHRK